MVLPLPFFAVFLIYHQWREYEGLKADRREAKLAMLKIQVNPHFFFNTLNNLYGLVVEKSPKAPEVVLKLSDMMRYTIYEGKKDLTRVSDELNYLESYIELHRLRYQKQVEIQFTKEIKKDVLVAPLLFIILLENAFKHGVESLTENAYIHLQLQADSSAVHFQVENNFDPEKPMIIGGIGLENLKKRLEHHYPGQYELRIEKRPEIYRAELHIQFNNTAKS
jgi:LytS/YehU family sensor histidine kinase